MKTFCIAYILGVFSGALLFAYFNSPETFNNLFPGNEPAEREAAAAKAGETVDKIADAAGNAVEKGVEKAKEFAESKQAEAIVEKGKQALESGKDSALALAVIGRLKLDDSIDSKGIKAKAAEGIVTLSGTVPDIAQEKRAIEIAANIPGVTGVKSEIKTTSAEE